jgi:hypothetical protein
MATRIVLGASEVDTPLASSAGRVILKIMKIIKFNRDGRISKHS